MMKKAQNLEVFLPDSKDSLRDELISGDKMAEIVQMLQRDFLFPDAEGRVKGFPSDFSFVMERVDVSSQGANTRLGRQIGQSEVANFRVSGTRSVLEYLQRNGQFLYLPSVIADEPLTKVGASVENAEQG